MRVYVDTDFIISLYVEIHIHHALANAHLERAELRGAVELVTSTHTLLESYSTLTRARHPWSLNPATARRVVWEALPKLAQLAVPTLETYRRAVALSEAAGLRSGGVYDAFHVATAERCDVDALWTFNGRHFSRFEDASTVRIVGLTSP